MPSIPVLVYKIDQQFIDCVLRIDCSQAVSLGFTRLSLPSPISLFDCGEEQDNSRTVEVEIIKYKGTKYYIQKQSESINRRCINVSGGGTDDSVIEFTTGTQEAIDFGAIVGANTIQNSIMAGKEVVLFIANTYVNRIDPGGGGVWMQKPKAADTITINNAVIPDETIITIILI
mgnify:CR=1 FL=1